MPNAIDTPRTSRRQALKIIAGAPILPLAGSAFLFAKPAGAAAAIASARFVSMAAPGIDNPAAMSTTTVGSGMAVKFADGTEQEFKLQYDTFFVSGMDVPDGKGGTVIAAITTSTESRSSMPPRPRPRSRSSSPTARTAPA